MGIAERNAHMIPRLPLLLLAATLCAQPAAAAAADADASVEARLKSLDYRYEVDEDGDFRLVFETGEKGERSQLVYVRSVTESYGEHRIREIWAPAYEGAEAGFPAAIANRLLEDGHEKKLGGWTKQGRYAVFVVKLSADAPATLLRDAIEAAAESADAMEAELTPGKDVL